MGKSLRIMALMVFLISCGEGQQAEPQVCGELRGVACGEGKYCNFVMGQCDVADAQGVCEEKPSDCTEEFAPVCGCDGKIYRSACKAAQAGISVDRQGECAQVPKG